MPGKSAPNTTPDWRAAARRRTRFYLTAAILLAVLFGVLVYQFFNTQRSAVSGPLLPVVFAAQDIPAGATLSAQMMERKRVSSRAVPPSHISYPEQLIGRKALYPMIKGEVILPEKLLGEQGSLMAERCPGGKWCVSIPAAWFTAEPPELAVGDRVDIASAQPGSGREEAGFIASEVQVVGVPGGESNPAYVLAFDDQEALSLLFAYVNEFHLLVLLRPAGS